MNHFAAHLKLTRCKSNVLQLKKKKDTEIVFFLLLWLHILSFSSSAFHSWSVSLLILLSTYFLHDPSIHAHGFNSLSYAVNSQICISRLQTHISNQLCEVVTFHLSHTEQNSSASTTQHETEIHEPLS